ncbi:putative aldo-keto reductase [Sphaerosporella brunnea]|uniref:Putative aldo-keto reductase n=1 Tax=Sphaerosporella brunnea TaxID=1250544 RepID=A0A5J5ELL8_9PEZI|nr:putative aldo-keto reductase [Sphaerosporella brunnea]
MSYGNSQWQKWVLDEDKALPLLKAAYDKGLNTWDTADFYSDGQSEVVVGKAIKEYSIPREQLVILSKCYFTWDSEAGTVAANDNKKWVNRCGLSRKHILDAVDRSVERLGTYIDVLQIHRLDRETPMEEIMKALDDVVKSGKVRYIGASSMYAWEFQALQNIAERNGWTKFISMQNYLNLLYREEEREMIPYCKATGVGLIPWSPLARGVLTRPIGAAPTTREEVDRTLKGHYRSRESEADNAIVTRVEEIAKKRGVSMATVGMAWVMKQGACPIVGMSSEERMDEAIAAIDFELSDEEARYLEEPYLPKFVMGI